ncbi:MAG: S-methyl-5-thioribose-1-phosphate isomerase [Candidatus Brockarchaeota archaeon]|nr:S-methyl-5-thioribose-1-phosphate isomerase [Candidatus Brockarchaeota archaeon]
MDSIRVHRDSISVVDQSLLPDRMVWLKLSSLGDFAKAIGSMKVRGAPLIGIVGAFGIALAAKRSKATSKGALLEELARAASLLLSTRPTGKNLSWALQRVLDSARSAKGLEEARRAAVRTARAILEEDELANRAIGKIGSRLVRNGESVLTHCNTGSLATGGYGTALGVIRAAWEGGKRVTVYATETRPLLQGSRLTCFELKRLGIPVKLIVDGAAGHVLSAGLVSKVFVGADRVLLSGHVINKVGTYPIAALAKENGVPFYVAAPTSTIDPETPVEKVSLEYRDASEVLTLQGRRIAPKGVAALNPAFDVTPPKFVSGIVTEKGVAYPPFRRSLKNLLEKPKRPVSA